MLHQGFEVTDIEAALGIDDNTIYRYAQAYQKVGLKSYIEDGYVSYSGKLTEEQLEILDEHLEEYCYAEAAEICHYIEQEFGVKYTPGGLVPLLHRLGYEYKCTKVVPGKANEAEQVEFLEQTLPELLAEVENGQAEVYYADGRHPTHNTRSTKGWIKKGQRFEVLANSGRKRLNINAAINALDPTKLVFDTPQSVNAQSTKNLCQQLLKKHRKKTIYLICDNARYNRNRKLQQWVADKRIKFIFLPPYSPNLNLIERLWRFLKQKIIHSYHFEQFSEFKDHILSFLHNIKLYKKPLQQLLTLNFRTVDGYSFYSHSS